MGGPFFLVEQLVSNTHKRQRSQKRMTMVRVLLVPRIGFLCIRTCVFLVPIGDPCRPPSSYLLMTLYNMAQDSAILWRYMGHATAHVCGHLLCLVANCGVFNVKKIVLKFEPGLGLVTVCPNPFPGWSGWAFFPCRTTR